MIDDPNTTDYSRQMPPGGGPPPGYPSSQGGANAGLAQIIITSVLVVVAFAAGWFGNGYANRTNYVSSGNERLVTQAWDDITHHYVVTGSIDQQKMAYAAISAMVGTLGDTGHSRFETPEELKQEQKDLQNAPTVGIGVYLAGGGTDPLRISAIIPNSPASKGNLKPGDEIVGVDGKDVRGQTIEQIRPLILGTAGTPVTLTVVRPSVDPKATFDVKLIRAAFTALTVESYQIPGSTIDYIQLTQFSQDADTQLRTALKDAKAHNATGIVLDLRGNPGGYLDQAVAVASEFIPSGQGKNVLIEKSRTGQQTEAVAPGGLATETPLVVLVDHDTASAAEIVAGAVSVDRPSVHTVGQTTFGTGTVLQEFMLADGSALWLGTQEWLLPNGHTIYHTGFVPDQPVKLDATASPLSPLVAQERNLNLQQIQQSNDTQLIQALKDLNT